jgi:hypothetical protein
MTLLQNHYLLCPPLACNTARIHLGIDSINRRIRSCGILPHSCSRACCSSCRVCSAGWRLRTRRSKFTGARFPDSCNGSSNPVQKLTVNVLSDLGSHQQPKIATSGYFTWETGPWQQEKQHQMSQVSHEYRHSQSENVSVKTAYASDVFTLAQYWDVDIDLQGSDDATE